MYKLGHSKLVLGSINNTLNDCWIKEIKALIQNKNIILKKPGFDNVMLSVLDVEANNSLLDQKNSSF